MRAAALRHYRLYALPGGSPRRPGLLRDMLRGDRIEAEVWAVPKAQLGTLVAGISAPLAIGKIKLDDGRWLTGFVCEQYAVVSAEEITALGGWRTYLSGE